MAGTESRITQAARLTVGSSPGDLHSRITQGVRLAVGAIRPPARITQAARLTVAMGRFPARITQAVRLTVAQAVGCVTIVATALGRSPAAMVWFFRFTSLDTDFALGSRVFKTCGSLIPSATEESSAIGTVSNIELHGILADDAITEADLYGGLFDDAFVEVWLWPFEGAESPRRLAAGWVGAVQHGEQGWTGDITGPGARLDQQSLVVPFAPACRWTFGDKRCTKDLTALQTTGTVLDAPNRGLVFTDAIEPGHGSQWENGRVIWQAGRNAGVTCEIKLADFAGTGDTEISLWALAPYLPEPGDTFIMQPGCDLSAATCKNVYANLINFGGFKDVPGNDAITATPIAKIDT